MTLGSVRRVCKDPDGVFPEQQAAAANAEYGLLEGKGAALVHPLLMAGLYLTTLYTGYQGLKWREVRPAEEPHVYTYVTAINLCYEGSEPLPRKSARIAEEPC